MKLRFNVTLTSAFRLGVGALLLSSCQRSPFENNHLLSTTTGPSEVNGKAVVIAQQTLDVSQIVVDNYAKMNAHLLVPVVGVAEKGGESNCIIPPTMDRVDKSDVVWSSLPLDLVTFTPGQQTPKPLHPRFKESLKMPEKSKSYSPSAMTFFVDFAFKQKDNEEFYFGSYWRVKPRKYDTDTGASCTLDVELCHKGIVKNGASHACAQGKWRWLGHLAAVPDLYEKFWNRRDVLSGINAYFRGPNGDLETKPTPLVPEPKEE